LSVRLFLDTTVLIDVLRGCPAAQRLRELHAGGASAPWVCAINIEEVWRGARPSEETGLARFLGGLRLAPIGRDEAERAGRWRRDFAARGVTLAQADCLIAAAAVGIGARLATGNPKHFLMEELTVEHWPVGT
jgi:predicted nucleic acid-binding protein